MVPRIRVAHMQPTTRYPTLFAHGGERQNENVACALDQIAASVATGAIRQKVYNDAKQVLGRAVELAYRATVQDRYLAAHQAAEQAPVIRDKLYYGGVASLHDVLALPGKIAAVRKAGAGGSVVEAAEGFVAELHELAQTMRDLRSKIIKGSVSRPAPVLTNPDQVRGTCPCCGSWQAVRSGRIVHHGYQRPGVGWQTASCAGVSFPPYERSPAGVDAMIELFEAKALKAQETLERRAAWDRIALPVSRGRPLAFVHPGEEGWDRAAGRRETELRAESAAAQRAVLDYRRSRNRWRLAALNKATGEALPLDFDG